MVFKTRRAMSCTLWPHQVSLVSTDDDPTFAWCHHGIAHIRWDNKPIVRHVLRWVNTVRKGTAHKKSITFPTKFMPGGSIGPAEDRNHRIACGRDQR
jgi:DNA-binding LacI/PurR family transcriptional regulator